jgi:hypothetical protein
MIGPIKWIIFFQTLLRIANAGPDNAIEQYGGVSHSLALFLEFGFERLRT